MNLVDALTITAAQSLSAINFAAFDSDSVTIASVCFVPCLAIWSEAASKFGTTATFISSAVKRVQEVATADIAPTSHPLSMSNVFRDDVVKPSLTNDEALSGAPAQAEDRFKVPQILGEE